MVIVYKSTAKVKQLFQKSLKIKAKYTPVVCNTQETVNRQLKDNNFCLISTLKADEIIRSFKMKTLPFKETRNYENRMELFISEFPEMEWC